MRSDVLDALRSLADRGYQEREWGTYREEDHRYDDLTLNVHLLYDDCRVLPNPASQVGTVLYAGDVEPLRRVGAVLGPLIDDLGEASDAEYLADPRWLLVVTAAAQAVANLEQRQ